MTLVFCANSCCSTGYGMDTIHRIPHKWCRKRWKALAPSTDGDLNTCCNSRTIWPGWRTWPAILREQDFHQITQQSGESLAVDHIEQFPWYSPSLWVNVGHKILAICRVSSSWPGLTLCWSPWLWASQIEWRGPWRDLLCTVCMETWYRVY